VPGTLSKSATPAGQTPRAEDRKLCRSRSWQQVRRRDRILELLGGQPAAPLYAEVAQQRHVRRRTAEADATDPRPLPHDLGELRRGRHGAGVGIARIVHRSHRTVRQGDAGVKRAYSDQYSPSTGD